MNRRSFLRSALASVVGAIAAPVLARVSSPETTGALGEFRKLTFDPSHLTLPPRLDTRCEERVTSTVHLTPCLVNVDGSLTPGSPIEVEISSISVENSLIDALDGKKVVIEWKKGDGPALLASASSVAYWWIDSKLWTGYAFLAFKTHDDGRVRHEFISIGVVDFHCGRGDFRVEANGTTVYGTLPRGTKVKFDAAKGFTLYASPDGQQSPTLSTRSI